MYLGLRINFGHGYWFWLSIEGILIFIGLIVVVYLIEWIKNKLFLKGIKL